MSCECVPVRCDTTLTFREGTMTPEEVRKTLRNETGLLGALIGATDSYEGGAFFTKQAGYIKDSWKRYLSDRANTNDDLADPTKYSDRRMLDALQEELDQIEKYIAVHDRQNEGLEEWITFLECERDILRYLLCMNVKKKKKRKKK